MSRNKLLEPLAFPVDMAEVESKIRGLVLLKSQLEQADLSDSTDAQVGEHWQEYFDVIDRLTALRRMWSLVQILTVKVVVDDQQ